MKMEILLESTSNKLMVEPEGSTQGYPLVSIEVLRYDKRSKSENMGIVPTEMELILEHTQKGITHEVSAESDDSDTYVLDESYLSWKSYQEDSS
nr:hypothetical protein [Tanacetum cinerariifolium]